MKTEQERDEEGGKEGGIEGFAQGRKTDSRRFVQSVEHLSCQRKV